MTWKRKKKLRGSKKKRKRKKKWMSRKAFKYRNPLMYNDREERLGSSSKKQ